MDEAILEPIGWLREWRSVVSQPMPGCLSCVHPVASTNPIVFSVPVDTYCVPVDTHCVPVEAPLCACRGSTICLSKVHSVPVEAPPGRLSWNVGGLPCA